MREFKPGDHVYVKRLKDVYGNTPIYEIVSLSYRQRGACYVLPDLDPKSNIDLTNIDPTEDVPAALCRYMQCASEYRNIRFLFQTSDLEIIQCEKI